MRLLIKEWRRARGFTQRQLARYLHISPSTLSRWERGARRSPGLWRLLEMARVLQIQPGMFFPWSSDEFVRQVLEPQVPDGDMREVLRAYIEDLDAGSPDTPLEQQALYHHARAHRVWSDTLWYLVVSRQAAAAEETRRLQQALDTPPEGGDLGKGHTAEREGTGETPR